MDVKLINLSNGDIILADPYNIKELGLPEGYVEVSSVTQDEWIEALQKAFNT